MKLGRRPTKNPRTRLVRFRLTPKEYQRYIKLPGKLYASGNESEWIRHCLREYKPKFLVVRKRGQSL